MDWFIVRDFVQHPSLDFAVGLAPYHSKSDELSAPFNRGAFSFYKDCKT